MKLSTIILNYKTPDLTIHCVESVQRQFLPFESEILVVDNSADQTQEQFKRQQNVRIISMPHNGGFAYGNNAGIRESTGEYILIINPDVIVREHSIPLLVQYLDTHADVGIVAPRLLLPDGTTQLSCSRFPNWKMPLVRRTPLGRTSRGKRYEHWYALREWNHETEQDVDWVVGAALLVRRRAIDEVGLLDEHFFMYVEDIDWCRRFWEKHWRVVYLPKASMTHAHTRASAKRSSLSGILDYPTRLHIRSFLYYLWKYRGKSHPHRMD